MTLAAQQVKIYMQDEIVMALSWEINNKTAKVWVTEDIDTNGYFDMCEISHDCSKTIKSFIRDVLKDGKYTKIDPMNFETVGFISD